MRTSNPALSGDIFQDWAYADRRSATMTMQGTAIKGLLLLLVLTATASLAWSMAGRGAVNGPMLIGSLIGGLIFFFATLFKPNWAPVTAPVYAGCEGILLGTISNLVNQRYPGIATQAVGLTFGVMFIMLFLYGTRIIRVTPKLAAAILAATGAVVLLYLISFVLSITGIYNPFIALHSPTPLGIGFSLFVVGLAAFNLLLDFDFIERGEASGAPKYLEWYGAFALMVTLIWLYLEILRLLRLLSDRR